MISKTKTLAYFFLYPTIAAVSISISAFEIFSSLFVILTFFSFSRERRWAFFKDRWIIFLGVYFLITLISWSGSGFSYESLRGVFRVFRCICLCLSAAYVTDSEQKFRSLVRCFLIVGTVIGLDAVVQGLTQFEWIRQREMTPYLLDRAYRVTGPYHHSNDFSAYLSLIIFVFWGVLTGSRRLLTIGETALYGLGFLMILASLIWTYARGAWFAVFACFLFWGILRRSKSVFVLLALLCLWGVYGAPETIRMRFHSTAQTYEGTFRERRLLWKEAIDMIHDRPWFGFGPNTYSKIEPMYKSKNVYTDNQYAHNGYLQIGAETGLLGLLSFLAVLAYFWISAYANFLRSDRPFLRTAGTALLFGILSFLMHSATDTNLQSLLLVNTLWLAMGVTWAAKGLAERDHAGNG